ncbi:MAG: hypothetical protein NTV23_12585 [Propionibacteriales bacterium]|nr:hypothetical protein [Propionibacteriales bacterium]
MMRFGSVTGAGPSLALCAVLLAWVAGCGGRDATEPGAVTAAQARIDEVSAATERWAAAVSLREARLAAEEVANLISGPEVPEYGDTDRDGRVAGARDQGLLPGEGAGAGLGLALAGCAGAPLLGGSWAEPQERWDELRDRIAQWRPDNNTFPSLESEALRVVGWARLTLRTSSLAEALEYSGHARVHVDATSDAIRECA